VKEQNGKDREGPEAIDVAPVGQGFARAATDARASGGLSVSGLVAPVHQASAPAGAERLGDGGTGIPMIGPGADRVEAPDDRATPAGGMLRLRATQFNLAV
jgi:hypothetical protein